MPQSEQKQHVQLSNGSFDMFVPVAEIESKTGLTKEVIRKWESRYGFPCPDRDQNGERIYPINQVENLLLIRRLLDAGMRPSKVVALDRAELELLTEQASLACKSDQWDFHESCLAALREHQPFRVWQLLQNQIHQQGLASFVQDTLPQLNILIGDAWLRGDVKIFEEHLYSQAVQDVLQQATLALPNQNDGPRILLTTTPGEIHILGLLMAKTVLTLNGATCVTLGAQTPIPEIVDAVAALNIDIVGLSFSIAQPSRTIARFLGELRNSLPPSVPIWAGGMGSARLPKRIEGVTPTVNFEIALEALKSFRLEQAAIMAAATASRGSHV